MTKLEAKKDLNFLNDKKRESGENRWMKKNEKWHGGFSIYRFVDDLL